MPDKAALEPRICAYPKCNDGHPVTFTPIRVTQVFHHPDCRKAYWKEAYHWTAHPCPLCTVRHDPEEPVILDAIEQVLRNDEGYSNGSILLQLERLIARRRAILTGRPEPAHI